MPGGRTGLDPLTCVSVSPLFSLLCPLHHQRVSLEFYIDVHAHSTMLNGFMYGNVFEDEERVQRQAVFPRLLCQNAPDFSFVSHTKSRILPSFYSGDRSEREHICSKFAPSPKLLVRWCSARHLIANCCTLSGTRLKTLVALGLLGE